MFHPDDHPLERGWVGRIDGDRVVHLAAQTLQSYFLGGGGAREHAEYPLGAVSFCAPVLHPPAVRLFEDADRFDFANPAAILSPGAEANPPTVPSAPTIAAGRTSASTVSAPFGACASARGERIAAGFANSKRAASSKRRTAGGCSTGAQNDTASSGYSACSRAPPPPRKYDCSVCAARWTTRSPSIRPTQPRSSGWSSGWNMQSRIAA